MSTLPTPSEMFADVVFTRFAAGSFVAGQYEAGAATPFTLRAHVMPPDDEVLRDLEEGERARRPLLVVTKDELRTANEEAATAADRMTYQGDVFEAVRVQRFGSPLLPHYETIFLRLENAA